MSEQPTPGTHAWERWVHEQRMAAIVARLRTKRQHVRTPPADVQREARARGERIAQLEARYRQLRIRERVEWHDE